MSSAVASPVLLVVEDDPGLARSMEVLLADLGYECMVVADSEHARQLLDEKGRRFDVAIVDIILPGLDGIELASFIRREHPGVGVILTTGFPALRDRQEAKSHILLLKPYRPRELEAAIAIELTRLTPRP